MIKVRFLRRGFSRRSIRLCTDCAMFTFFLAALRLSVQTSDYDYAGSRPDCTHSCWRVQIATFRSCSEARLLPLYRRYSNGPTGGLARMTVSFVPADTRMPVCSDKARIR